MSEALALAYAAKSELPTVSRAVELLKVQIAQQWGEEADPAKREALWHRLRVLDDIVQMLVAAAAEADVAEHRATLAGQGFQP